MPGNEAFVVLKVVDRTVGLIATDVRRQKLDNVVFTDGEANIALFPIGAVGGWAENERAADDGPVGLGISRRADAVEVAGRCPKYSEASSRG